MRLGRKGREFSAAEERALQDLERRLGRSLATEDYRNVDFARDRQGRRTLSLRGRIANELYGRLQRSGRRGVLALLLLWLTSPAWAGPPAGFPTEFGGDLAGPLSGNVSGNSSEGDPLSGVVTITGRASFAWRDDLSRWRADVPVSSAPEWWAGSTASLDMLPAGGGSGGALRLGNSTVGSYGFNQETQTWSASGGMDHFGGSLAVPEVGSFSFFGVACLGQLLRRPSRGSVPRVPPSSASPSQAC